MSQTSHPSKPTATRGFFWPIAIFMAVMLYVQWPAVEDLYYQLSGIERPKSLIAWRDDFDAGLAEVRSSDKPMLLVFSASWCGPCKTMKQKVWSDVEVGNAVAAGYVPVHIDVDDVQHASVTDRYRVNSIPAVFVLDGSGKIVGRESYMSRSEALAFLDASRRDR